MPTTLVECVPNFSEGRDPAKVDAIVAAMKIPASISLTAKWTPTTTAASSRWSATAKPFRKPPIRGVGKAAELIDLTRHQGAHPRMGAADVIPFIPIDGLTLEDCVAMARHVGAEIARRFEIPVYLYEARRHPPPSARTSKISVRGQFEGIRDEIAPTTPASRISASPASIPPPAPRS